MIRTGAKSAGSCTVQTGCADHERRVELFRLSPHRGTNTRREHPFPYHPHTGLRLVWRTGSSPKGESGASVRLAFSSHARGIPQFHGATDLTQELESLQALDDTP